MATTPERPRVLPPLPVAPRAVQQLIEQAGLTWIDIVHPNDEQLTYLGNRYHFHQLHLADVRKTLQRPKLDDNDDPEYIFLVLHIPVFDTMNRLPVISEVDLFVRRDCLISLHDGRVRALVHLVRDAQHEAVRQRFMGQGSGRLLYSLIEVLINTCFPQVYKLYEKLDQVDADMFRADTQDTVKELSFLRRDIISLRRIVRPNIAVLHSLATHERAFLRVDEDVYFGNLVDSLSKLWDMLEEQKEIIEGLDATLSSLTSHRINREMRTFTLISMVFLPMTLIASVLGMNVVIPLAESPFSLIVSLLLISAAGALMVYYCRRRGWI
jgi:magnesium transporter